MVDRISASTYRVWPVPVNLNTRFPMPLLPTSEYPVKMPGYTPIRLPHYTPAAGMVLSNGGIGAAELASQQEAFRLHMAKQI